MDSAVGRARSTAHHGQGFGRQPIDPFIGRDGLAGLRIGSEGRPVAFLLDFLVGNRPFHNQDKGVQLPLFGFDTKT